MAIADIRQSIESVIQFFSEHPDKASPKNKTAVAVVEEGLRCRAEGPNGAVLISDMPKAVGGGGASPTPGWFLCAALANCDATVIAMRAAQLGVVLSLLEVTVDSHADDRGLLGVDGVLPGPLNVRVRVRITADGVGPEQLREIVGWAEAHSPVGDALRRAVPLATDIEIVPSPGQASPKN